MNSRQTARTWATVGLLATALAFSGCGSQAASEDSASATSPSVSASPQRSYPDSIAWYLPAAQQATDSEIAFFTSATSVLAGEPVTIYSQTSAPATIAAYRITVANGAGGQEVLTPQPLNTVAQPAAVTDPDTRMVRAPWQPTGELDTTDWPPGLYLLQVQAGGKGRNIPFVVRDADLSGKVVYVAGDTTWQAYNTWGGRSLYTGPNGFGDRSYAVSFDRPYSAKDWDIWNDYDVSLVRTITEADANIGYTTVAAIAADPKSVQGAEGILSNGHDEYWPLDYRTALEEARDSGTDLAFLGANAGFWRVRLADSDLGKDRVVIGYKSASLDPVKNSPETTARSRDLPEAMPESRLVGQLYDCFPSKGDATITEPGFFLFDGTNVAAGSKIPGLIGNESDRAYADADTPRPIQVPAISQVSCKSGTTYSTMVYYTVPSGAGVFSTGTMNWTRALTGPSGQFGLTQASTDFVRAVTLNLVTDMAAGQMGSKHPAQDDFESLRALGNANNAG